MLFTKLSGAIAALIAAGLLAAVPASASFEQVGTFTPAEAQSFALNIAGTGGVPSGTLYLGRQRYGPYGEHLGENPTLPFPATVDQATGDTYGMLDTGINAGGNTERHIEVHNADGTQLIAGFGEAGGFEETIEEGPEKFHSDNIALTVDSSGTLYVSDRRGPTQGGVQEEYRVMVFEPETPGDYEHYVYAGRARDIGYSKGQGPFHGVGILLSLAVDEAGSLYAATESRVYEFDPGLPSTPVCEFQAPTFGINAMTVDPASGEVFYFDRKDKKIHQLSACDSQGKFVEKSAFAPSPKASDIEEMVFNPVLAYSAPRAPGVLYALDAPFAPQPTTVYTFARSPASVPPAVLSESVSSVSASTATLAAQINPKGQATSYIFQYLTDAEFEANDPAEPFAGAAEAPLGGAPLGSGQAALSAATSLIGLAPDTEYHYRAVASSHCDPEDESKVCEGTGPGQTFHTFPIEAPALPDRRAYELVSPPDKNGGEVFPAEPEHSSCPIITECKPGANAQHYPMQSSPDGEALIYQGFPFSLTEGAAVYNEYLSRRTAGGWQTTILAPSLLGTETQGYKAFDAGLTRGVFYQLEPSLTPEAPFGYANLYAQPTASPSSLTPLVTAEPPNRPPGELGLQYAGASDDLSHVFFAANDALTVATPFAPQPSDPGSGKDNLYESSGGQLRLVNVLPGNAETVPGAFFGAPALNNANVDGGNWTADLSHAISDDGSRAFWSDETGQVYVRVDGEATIEVPDPAKFLTASADGSKLLLRDGHVYDLETEATTDLTEGQGGFLGIAGQSEDLSRLYFTDTAVLSGEEENQHGAKAEAGQNNLYAWQQGHTSFIATLFSGGNNNQDQYDWQFSPGQRTAQASPDGRWLSFRSQEPLTGYDSTNPFCDIAGGAGPCTEVFLYDSATGSLACPSCNPSGAPPSGSSVLPLIRQGPGEDPIPQPRYLTDDGRLYFDSQDSLTPFDTNDGVEDVYQYEPEGVGDPPCQHQGGCVNLISAGHEPVDSNLLAVDATGANVFFTTRDQLLSKDRDELIDVYDARQGGGIASETEVARGECQGEACQPPVSPPNDPTPGSSSFEGAGNVHEQGTKSCPKGKVRKHGKCAKKHKSTKHHKHHHRAVGHNPGGRK